MQQDQLRIETVFLWRNVVIIPWQVDVPQEHRPFINWLLITSVIVAFVFQMMSIIEHRAELPDKIKEYENHSVEEVAKDLEVDEQQLKEIEQLVDKRLDEIKKAFPYQDFPEDLRDQVIKKNLLQKYFVWGKVRPFILDGGKIKGLFGHMWLHGGILHLLGNILFLWIFGNAVCSKIGNTRYLPLYIFLGLLAAMAHLIFQGGSAIGASGAIMGVVGMYLVFFPQNDITCYFVWFLFFHPIIRGFTISSYWMVLFWVIFDIWGAAKGGGTTAYFAHLGGFFAGMFLAILMLKTKWVEMNPRYERSLLDVFAKKPEPDTDKGADPRFGWMMQQTDQPPDQVAQNEQIAEPSASGQADLNDHSPRSTPPASAESAEAMIRFMCPCGRRIKVPARYAGKMGKCPRCKNRLRIPQQTSP